MFLFGINGTTQESILSLINERRLEDTIRFMGTADDINNYLQAMDLMLLPSLYEGFPVTVVDGKQMVFHVLYPIQLQKM